MARGKAKREGVPAGDVSEEATGASAGGAGEGSEEEVGLDEALERLERLVGELEQGGTTLEEALEKYREGVRLLGSCRRVLERFRRQVEELGAEAERDLAAFEEDPDAPSGDGR